MTTPTTLNDALTSTYLRYVNTAYWLSDPRLMRERQRLLAQTGMLTTPPYLEPVLAYDATDDLVQTCQDAIPVPAGTDPAEHRRTVARVARTVGQALVGDHTPPGQPLRLRRHQAEAVQASFSTRSELPWNIVVTSGTGSGKTEKLLLPVLLRLALEAQTWRTPSEPHLWWAKRRWTPQTSLRATETREAGLRAVVLYPTNALVEDQMARLRKAVHRLDDAGIPLWFGRLTGASLGSVQPPTTPSGARRTAEEVRALQDDVDRMRQALTDDPDLARLPDEERRRQVEDRLALFSDPRRNEMLVRWDMTQSPPDILVTNFSMLNAVLMRDAEQAMFDRTRDWLADTRNVFTLVVDELHLQRGTAGSEVAMVLRSFLRRIGLAPDSPQLRVVGTSASLDEGGANYLEQFFGVSRDTFQVRAGQPRHPEPLTALTRAQVLAAPALEQLGTARQARRHRRRRLPRPRRPHRPAARQCRPRRRPPPVRRGRPRPGSAHQAAGMARCRARDPRRYPAPVPPHGAHHARHVGMQQPRLPRRRRHPCRRNALRPPSRHLHHLRLPCAGAAVLLRVRGCQPRRVLRLGTRRARRRGVPRQLVPPRPGAQPATGVQAQPRGVPVVLARARTRPPRNRSVPGRRQVLPVRPRRPGPRDRPGHRRATRRGQRRRRLGRRGHQPAALGPPRPASRPARPLPRLRPARPRRRPGTRTVPTR